MDLTLSILAILALVNVLSFLAYGIDKVMAVKGWWRISERSLLILALFGPFGAYAGMLLFRHKTRHAKFLLVPVFAIVQLCLLVYFFFF